MFRYRIVALPKGAGKNITCGVTDFRDVAEDLVSIIDKKFNSDGPRFDITIVTQAQNLMDFKAEGQHGKQN